MSARGVWLVAACVLLAGCGGGLSSAESAFKKGRYPEAKQRLVALEPEAKTWNGRPRAEYALYRGLVHHSLGDRDAAKLWLHEAKALDDAQPGTLQDEDATRLRVALESLDDERSRGD